ncbi:hypothetical protein GGU45_002296 [Niabella hirudinis]
MQRKGERIYENVVNRLQCSRNDVRGPEREVVIAAKAERHGDALRVGCLCAALFLVGVVAFPAMTRHLCGIKALPSTS